MNQEELDMAEASFGEPSKKTTLNIQDFIFLDPETRKVITILSLSPIGMHEYDPEAEKWVALGDSDTWRVRDLFNNYVKYQTDWENEKAFDENNKSIVLSKYSDGSLDEAWLKENTIFAGDVLKEE